jgi:hypothetical protein
MWQTIYQKYLAISDFENLVKKIGIDFLIYPKLLIIKYGEGGIRTPARLPQNAFRVRHHQPLGHLSKLSRFCLIWLTPIRILS